MTEGTLLKTALNNSAEVTEIRRTIHRHPEIGRNEFKTSELIRNKLTEYGVDEIKSYTPTSVVAIIKGGMGEGRCLAIRADIDALPVTEDTGLPFASEVEGMMHACGHDMHAAMLLGVAKMLCSMRDRFKGTVKLIFQHSEDTLPGGAKELTEKGVMEDPKVDAIFGMHIMPDEKECGKLAFIKGPITTSVDLYDFTVKGKSGHGSAPHTTNDPILAACQTVVLLQQIPSRYVDPMETVVFPVCSIHSGDAPNVIPEEAKFSGIARGYSEEVRKVVDEQVYKIAKGVEEISGCKIDINHYEGYPACVNDAVLTEDAMKAVERELGEGSTVLLDKPMSFSEDFSYYTNMTGTPGMYMFLYAGHEGELVPLHNPKMHVKEEAMPYGCAAMTAAALDYLNR